MANQGKARGVSIGVYTSSSQWTPITGGSTKMSSYPLWYVLFMNFKSLSYGFSLLGMLTTTPTLPSLTSLLSAAGPLLPSSSTLETSPSALPAGTRTTIKQTAFVSLDSHEV